MLLALQDDALPVFLKIVFGQGHNLRKKTIYENCINAGIAKHTFTE